MFNSKVFLAELIGTFALIFIGAGAGISGAGLVGVALAHGLTVMAFAYAYGHISGTHINPAVTFGLALKGVIKWSEAGTYWVAQFAGAALGALALKSFFGDISGGATTGALTASTPLLAMAVEAILTFFLVNSILQTAVAGKAGNMAGWAIGATLVVAILAGGSLTGASLNPARTFGPALFAAPSLADVNTYVIYLFGPLIGATVAVLVSNFFEGEKEESAPMEMPAVAKKSAVRNSAKK